MKTILFVVNPCAGKKKANGQLAQIIDFFNRAGYETITYMTAGQGDATRIVRERGGSVDRIVCCGGDGTFNEVVSGVLAQGLTTPIGYLPAGSTNDFAASLQLPTDLLEAAKLCVEGTPTAYDVGSFDGRYFSYVASFGAFTRSSYATPQNVKNALGHMAYVLDGIQELGQLKNIHMRVELSDGMTVEDDFLFGAISNSTSIGGILTLDPEQVDMQDGKLEVLLIRAPREFGELSACIRAISQKQYNCAMVTFLSTKSLRVVSDTPVDWTLDGELAAGKETAEINCLPSAIRLLKGDKA